MAETSEIRDDIRRADDTVEVAFGRQDAAAVGELYTEDAMLLPPGSDFVRGRDAIRSFWQGAFDMGIARVKLEIVEAEAHGEGAIEMGRYTLTAGDGSVVDEGKYIVSWKRVDGAWKLHRDVWNTSRPPQDG